MNTKLPVGVGVILSVALLNALLAADEPKREHTRDFDHLAQNVVLRSAHIKEDDLVSIYGHFTDAALLEALAVQVRKQGGHPLIIESSYRLTRRLFDGVPAKFDSQEPKFALKMAEIVDARIYVASDEDTALAGVPAERLTAWLQAGESVRRLLLQRNVRLVELGNGLYPTAARAKLYGLSEAELADIFWDGLNVDYAKMQATGLELQRTLSNGKELHLTNANGTDLRMKIENRPVFLSDGNLTPEKIQKGGAAVWTYLPAGEVAVAPVPASAEGEVIIDRVLFGGTEITGLAMAVKAGRVTSLRAQAGGERLLAMYDAAGAGKEQIGVLDVGINPNVRIPKKSKLLVYMAAGMISVWLGNDTWAGGDNNVPFSAGGFLPGSTLELDGKVIVENGVLKL